MEQHDGYIWRGRTPIQRVAPQDIYAALRKCGVGESQAAAVAARLITVRIKGGK